MTIKTYKGFEVVKEIIHDYEYPEIALVLSAPCGCMACEDEVQEGHFACNTSPKDLRNDSNVYPRLEGSRWFWEYTGHLGYLKWEYDLTDLSDLQLSAMTRQDMQREWYWLFTTVNAHIAKQPFILKIRESFFYLVWKVEQLIKRSRGELHF